MYPCKKCRGPIADGETVCPVCGWDQAEEPPAAERKVPDAVGKQPAPDRSAGENKAPAARPVYQPTIRSCPVCGGPLGTDDMACAVCGLRDPLNASPGDIAEYRRLRDEKAAEEAARISEVERWKAQKAAEAEQKRAAVRDQIAAREKEADAVKKKMNVIKAAIAVAIAVLAVGAFGMMANSATTAKKVISGDDLPEWTAENTTGDVVRLSAVDVDDWFTVTTTTTSGNSRLPSSGSYMTKTYRGFAGLKTEDGRKVYIYYSIPNADAAMTKLADKYEQVSLVELGEYTFPTVREPFTVIGKLVRASSVITTTGFDSSSMAKYNEIKDIPFLDTTVTTKTITVPVEGAKERLSNFSLIAVIGLALTAVVAVVLVKNRKRFSAVNDSVNSLRRQLDRM